MNIFSLEYWIQQLLALPAILLGLSMHEMAHGLVSYKLGDPTPKQMGRLSLNPMAHLDPIGAICLFFFHFGWAKPVQIDSRYYKHPKSGIVLVSLAGVAMNFILAFITLLVLALMQIFLAPIIPLNEPAIRIYNIIYQMIYYGVIINLSLGVFNLLPIPPLDGSKVLFALLPSRYYGSILKYERYGMLILLVLLCTNIVTRVMNPCVSGIYRLFLAIVNLIV